MTSTCFRIMTPAIIKKMIDAKISGKNEIIIWGTGKVSREFLYVEDAAEGILLATEKYNKSDPVNLGTGHEITIKDLVDLLANLTDYVGKIKWVPSKPGGQPRRSLDTGKAEEEFGFEAKTNLTEGLKRTIHWYLENLVEKKGRE